MTLEVALDLCREALLVSLLLSAPVLAVGLLVGLGVSLVQTVTQLQDQTISIVPKIVAMVGAAVLVVPWLAERLLGYTQQMLAAP